MRDKSKTLKQSKSPSKEQPAPTANGKCTGFDEKSASTLCQMVLHRAYSARRQRSGHVAREEMRQANVD